MKASQHEGIRGCGWYQPSRHDMRSVSHWLGARQQLDFNAKPPPVPCGDGEECMCGRGFTGYCGESEYIQKNVNEFHRQTTLQDRRFPSRVARNFASPRPAQVVEARVRDVSVPWATSAYGGVIQVVVGDTDGNDADNVEIGCLVPSPARSRRGDVGGLRKLTTRCNCHCQLAFVASSKRKKKKTCLGHGGPQLQVDAYTAKVRKRVQLVESFPHCRNPKRVWLEKNRDLAGCGCALVGAHIQLTACHWRRLEGRGATEERASYARTRTGPLTRLRQLTSEGKAREVGPRLVIRITLHITHERGLGGLSSSHCPEDRGRLWTTTTTASTLPATTSTPSTLPSTHLNTADAPLTDELEMDVTFNTETPSAFPQLMARNQLRRTEPVHAWFGVSVSVGWISLRHSWKLLLLSRAVMPECTKLSHCVIRTDARLRAGKGKAIVIDISDVDDEKQARPSRRVEMICESTAGAVRVRVRVCPSHERVWEKKGVQVRTYGNFKQGYTGVRIARGDVRSSQRILDGLNRFEWSRDTVYLQSNLRRCILGVQALKARRAHFQGNPERVTSKDEQNGIRKPVCGDTRRQDYAAKEGRGVCVNGCGFAGMRGIHTWKGENASEVCGQTTRLVAWRKKFYSALEGKTHERVHPNVRVTPTGAVLLRVVRASQELTRQWCIVFKFSESAEGDFRNRLQVGQGFGYNLWRLSEHFERIESLNGMQKSLSSQKRNSDDPINIYDQCRQ
ncbi:hypothetical protein B0H11DRAFT_2358783 [Mycena galericulata]|nr:hypothetical protein B0H11DRAFT_2358783 [Mycena galericulata]